MYIVFIDTPVIGYLQGSGDLSALSGMNPETRHKKTVYFQGAGTE